MKKLIKVVVLVLIYLAIAAGIVWLSYIAAEICDDIIPRWSIKSYVGPCISVPAIAIYWLRIAAKKLKSWKV